jgi:pyridoxal phosphate enzyme (YggS family)
MVSPSEALQVVTTRLRHAATEAGRDPASITLVAVGKTQPASALRALAELGQRDFGESYVQEARTKQAELAGLPLTWHFIGPIQSNKTRAIAEHFDWAHGVGRAKIAERLSDQRPAHLPALNCCIEVNLDMEASKSGLPEHEVAALAEHIAALPRLKLRGLMAIPAPSENATLQRAKFRRLRELRDALNARGLGLDTLSMGMSDDFEAAILEGATHIRVGTALFGAREHCRAEGAGA